jgi:galactitol-specific phosphotransferase system IIB component
MEGRNMNDVFAGLSSLLVQHNHVDIICSITNLTQKYNRFPSRYEISIDTKLSIKTISKHIKEYFNSKEYSTNIS